MRADLSFEQHFIPQPAVRLGPTLNLFEDLRVRDQKELNRDFYNRRFGLIAGT